MPVNTQLDIRRVPLTAQGVEGLFWPLSFECQKAFGDDLLYGTVSLIREALQRDTPGAREFMAVAHFVLPLAISGFCWEKVRLGFAGQGLEPDIPVDAFQRWACLSRGEAIPWTTTFLGLQQAFEPHGAGYYFRKYRDRLSKVLRRGKAAAPRAAHKPQPGTGPRIPVRRGPKIASLPPWRPLPRDAVVATKQSRLLSASAAASDADVFFARHRRWFRPVDVAEARGRMARALAPQLRSAFLDLVRELFVKHGAGDAPAAVLESVAQALDAGCALSGVHLERFTARGVRLPERLWTGSAGNIWDRLLRVAVRERGGSVTGHDHAGGVNYMQDPGVFSIIEFAACDRYVTYCEAQAAAVERITADKPQFQGRPQISSAPQEAFSRLMEVGRRGRVRRVMYVGGLFRGDIIFFFPNVQNVVMVDFEARLFAWLRGRGFEVLYKPHPESRSQMPPAYRELGVEIVEGGFEDTAHLADVIIFPHAATTTFNLTLRTDLPMVLLDFGHWDWQPGTLDRLERRCPVVPGSTRHDNVLDCDWGRLAEAIRAAPHKTDDDGFARMWL